MRIAAPAGRRPVVNPILRLHLARVTSPLEDALTDSPGMSTSPLRKLRLSLVLALILGIAFGVASTVTGSPITEDTPWLRWLLAGFLAALGVLGVQALRFFVIDVMFLRAQGHRAPALVHAVVSMGLYFVLVLLIAGGIFHQSLTGALATSAAASVVLGLALQDTLGNFFAGIALQIEHPFKLEDVIRTDEREGRVESFNWRTTTIRTPNSSRIVIPNSVVAREPLEVFPRSEATRRIVPFPAPFGAVPQRIITLISDAVAAVPGVAAHPPPRVRIGDFDASSLRYEVLYWVRDYLKVTEIDAQVRERIWYVYGRNNIALPFPHVDLRYDPPTEHDTEASEQDRVQACDQRLDNVELLTPLTDDERRLLAEHARTLRFGPGEQLLHAGRAGSSMFVITSGRVSVSVSAPDGHTIPLAELGPGDVIGEMSLLTGEPRSADVWALDEVEVIEVRRTEMRHVLAENDALAEALARQVSTRRDKRTEAIMHDEEDQRESEETVSLLWKIQHFFDLA